MPRGRNRRIAGLELGILFKCPEILEKAADSSGLQKGSPNAKLRPA